MRNNRVSLLLLDNSQVRLFLTLQPINLLPHRQYGLVHFIDLNLPLIEIGTDVEFLLLKHIKLVL